MLEYESEKQMVLKHVSFLLLFFKFENHHHFKIFGHLKFEFENFEG